MIRNLALFAGISVIIYLLYRILQALEKQPQDKPRQDPLNIAGYEDRKNRFEREIQIEERLGKK